LAEHDSETTLATSMPTDALNPPANGGEPDLDPQVAGIGRDTAARMDELDRDAEARMDAIGLDADTMRSLEAPPDDSESGRTP
jgi:hypothetical protein